jgi:hypothetical protein
MHRGTIAAVAGFLLAIAIAVALFGMTRGEDDEVANARPGRFSGVPAEQGGLTVPARVEGSRLALAIGGSFEPRFWPGVNLGATTPGHHPGELAPTRRDYDRWLDGMRQIGARLVRVYTILPPAFYEALDAHNRRHPDAPLYFIQGVWIPEEEFLAAQDAYAPAVTRGFDDEIADAVAVVHGDADLAERPGHAAGRYRTNVARWLLAWSPGVEWDPEATEATDRGHRGEPPDAGHYITATQDATPMERWIAGRLDHLATLEAERGWSRPLTFTNWLTTDPLDHPTEPLENEDRVAIDAMHLRATDRWPGGFFASYHAYPYYPDFLRLEPAYRRARDPYAAYLRDLKAHHRDQAVMVTEFGVPTGIGVAHRGPLGRDQGDHPEREAGAMKADMLRAIEREDYAGGVLFEWTDEWFKRTWNTVDVELPPDRRPLWPNALTNEEQFGIVAVEPGKRPAVTLDGRPDEWASNGSRELARDAAGVQELRATHDAGSLYLLVRGRPAGRLTVGFDVRPGGNRGVPGRPGVAPEADVALTLGPGRRARVMHATWTDPISFQYGVARDYLAVDREDVQRGSGAWVSPRLILSRPYRVPATGEVRATELADVGRLHWATADGADSRATVAGDDAVTEVRIPWALLTFADPSSRLVWEPRASGVIATRRVGPLGIELAGESGPAAAAADYGWDGWNRIDWHERRKAGWDTVAGAFADTSR